jgi:hypothetical protein
MVSLSFVRERENGSRIDADFAVCNLLFFARRGRGLGDFRFAAQRFVGVFRIQVA